MISDWSEESKCTFRPQIITYKKPKDKPINIKGYNKSIERQKQAQSNPKYKGFEATLRETSPTIALKKENIKAI